MHFQSGQEFGGNEKPLLILSPSMVMVSSPFLPPPLVMGKGIFSGKEDFFLLPPLVVESLSRKKKCDLFSRKKT